MRRQRLWIRARSGFRPPPLNPIVILNLFQDKEQPSHVILKQVQDDERGRTSGIFEDNEVAGSHPPSPHRVQYLFRHLVHRRHHFGAELQVNRGENVVELIFLAHAHNSGRHKVMLF